MSSGLKDYSFNLSGVTETVATPSSLQITQLYSTSTLFSTLNSGLLKLYCYFGYLPCLFAFPAGGNKAHKQHVHL